ncbi:T9SS type A sorting domain-containing protein [Hymenobacter sp. ASUV-10]|uniref:T9SS type A sorting domain-containing protein n=1 Tax=Hymenobacter aranciens TaxID=3063996 RepID=A0ABT9BG74_9BACT|nr:T9SS type A sorting domain-containing protein [Hymenobacter sp. ASUV-10]MDO7876790.1 T9SS type A sorting domain-containing protein [Hymenobacter sp. ASUV-10]
MQAFTPDFRPWLAGLGLLLSAPLAASAQVLTNNGGTLFVNTGGVLTVNGGLAQTGPALLRTAGAATVSGDYTGAAAATLDLSSGLLDVAGDVAHQGPTAGTTGTLRLSGSAAQTLNTAGGTVPNLTVDKPSGTATLSGPVRVREVLTMADAGNLATNGQALTLLSDATGTALLANTGTGTVAGNLTVQRYIAGDRNPGLGYRHLAAPVAGQAVAAFGSGGTALVVNPAYNTAASPGTVMPFPTVFAYDQARLATSPATTYPAFDKGWVSPATTGAAAPVGTQGFTVQLPGASTLRFGGAATQQGSVVLPMSRNSGATAADAGWNLVGNPYASPLDLSTVTAAQRTSLDAAVYVFESTSQYGGQYRSYVNGLGSGNPLLGSSQGFWMRVSAGQTSGSLTLTNANRVTDYAQQAPVRRSTGDTRPRLTLALAGANLRDELYLYAQAGATAGTDGEFDATKLPNPHGLNLASLAASGQQLAIDGRADFTSATSIPLFVGVPAAGQYTLTAAALANLASTRVELVDNLTNTRTPLTGGTSYAFTMSATTAPGRFWLNLTPAAAPLATAAALDTQVLAYPNPAHGQLTVLRPAATVATGELLNSLGQRVRTLTLPTAETTVNLPGLATGVYTLRLTLDGHPVTKRIVVE